MREDVNNPLELNTFLILSDAAACGIINLKTVKKTNKR